MAVFSQLHFDSDLTDAAGTGSKLRIGAAYNSSYSFTGAYIDQITIADPEATIVIRPQSMTGGM